VDCHVDVRIAIVDDDEIDRLNTVLSALPDVPVENHIFHDQLHTEYVVTIDHATLTALKKVLHVVVPVVQPDRIEIET